MIFQLNATELSSLINMILNVLLITLSSPPPTGERWQAPSAVHDVHHQRVATDADAGQPQRHHRSPDCRRQPPRHQAYVFK